MEIFLEFIVFLLAVSCLVIPLFWVYSQYRKGAPFSLFIPVLILLLFILIGVTLKVFYIQFIRPDDIVAILGFNNDRMLQNRGHDVLLPGLLAILTAIIAFLWGYSVKIQGYSFSLSIEEYSFNRSKLKVTIGVLLLISLLAFLSFYFYEYFYISSESSIQKRFNSLEGGSTSRLLHFHYYAYKVSTFVRYGVYLTLLYILSSKGKASNRQVIVLFITYVLSVFISSYFGNRAHILILLFDVSLIFLLFQSSKYNRLYLVFFILSIAILMLSTVIRQASYTQSDSIKFEEASSIQNNLTPQTFDLLENNTLNKHQVFKLELYQQCRERIIDAQARHKVYTSQAFWGIEAKKLAPPGVGEASLPVRIINSLFQPESKRDICSGGIDVINEPQLAEPLSSRHRKLLGTAERFLQGGYFIDVRKTSHLVRKVPNEMGYLNGQSLVGWLFAPISPNFWPDKPLFMRMPPVLSTIIFNEPTNNMPPGVIAELYINFGWPGILIGMFLIGFLLRYFHSSFYNHHKSIIAQSIYAIILVRMMVILFNSSFGTAVLKTGLDLIPLLLMLWFVLEKKKSNSLEK